MKRYLKQTDQVRVSRRPASSLVGTEYTVQEMTVAEAVEYGAWDTCRGTMAASVETPDGDPVYLDAAGRAHADVVQPRPEL